MDIDEFEHLSKLLAQHLRNLRVLETQAATFGSSNAPLHLQNQIYEERQEIKRIRKSLTVFTSQDLREEQVLNFTKRSDRTSRFVPKNLVSSSSFPASNQELEDEEAEDDEAYSYLNHFWNFLFKVGLMNVFFVTLFMLGVVVGLYSFITYRLSVKLEDSFTYSQGLHTWKSTGIVSIVNDNRTITNLTNSVTDTTTTPSTSSSSALEGAVQVMSSPNAKIYHAVPGVASKGKVYLAEAWCKASRGATCTMFLGPQSDTNNAPPPADFRSVSREGNGEWQSMVLSYELEQDENLFLFLYAQGANQPVLFDDVLVRTDN